MRSTVQTESEAIEVNQNLGEKRKKLGLIFLSPVFGATLNGAGLTGGALLAKHALPSLIPQNFAPPAAMGVGGAITGSFFGLVMGGLVARSLYKSKNSNGQYDTTAMLINGSMWFLANTIIAGKIGQEVLNIKSSDNYYGISAVSSMFMLTGCVALAVTGAISWALCYGCHAVSAECKDYLNHGKEDYRTNLRGLPMA